MQIQIVFILFWTQIICKEYRIAFGSCYDYMDNQTKSFDSILRFEPDLFIWLGDSAYVTNKTNKPRGNTMNESKIEEVFNQTKNHPSYSRLSEQVQIEGIWDDHDYNENDGDYQNPTKEIIRQKYLNFLNEPIDSTRRTNPNGIYYSFYIGNNIQVILLDVRWNKQPKNDSNPQDILGSEQFNWLQDELIKSKAKYQLIGSGSQILPNDRMFIEVWYEQSRERLLNLISLYGKNVVFLSGDVHFAEILIDPCFQLNNNKSLYYEITSSGLSKSYLNYGIFSILFETFVYIFIPDSYSNMHDRYIGLNFGGIIINEEEDSLTLQIFDEYGRQQLIKQQSIIGSHQQIQNQCEKIINYPKYMHYFYNFNSKISKIFQLRIIPLCITMCFTIFLIYVAYNYQSNKYPKLKKQIKII